MKKIAFINLVLLTIASCFLTSCEKVIDVDLPDGEKLLYADAWITDQPGEQVIKVFKAANYFSKNGPEPVADAQVKLHDLTDGNTYNFVYNNGKYVYNPGSTERIGFIDHEYKLEITALGEQYEAFDQINRVPPVDSITFKFKKGASKDDPDGYEAKFYAKDLAGKTDYYWIRTYLNGKLHRYVQEMYSIDGSFYEDISDGFPFIPPIQESITDPDHLFQKNDKVKVLIRSLSKQSYEFIKQVSELLEDDGIFETIPANIKSNFRNVNPNSSKKLLGWFGTTAESSLEKQIQ